MVLAWMPLALGRKGKQRSRRTVSELSSTIETVGFTSESRTSRVILAGRGVFFLAKRKKLEERGRKRFRLDSRGERSNAPWIRKMAFKRHRVAFN